MRPARDTKMTRWVSCVLRGIGRAKAAAAGWGWWVANVPDCHFFRVPHARAPDAPLPILNRFDSSTAANSAPGEGCAVGTEYPRAAFVTLAQNFLAVACSLKTRRLTADRVS